jgi:hypothetical protein
MRDLAVGRFARKVGGRSWSDCQRRDGATKCGVHIPIQPRLDWRYRLHDPGPAPPVSFSSSIIAKQPADPRCSAAATPLFPALLSLLFVRCYFSTRGSAGAAGNPL